MLKSGAVRIRAVMAGLVLAGSLALAAQLPAQVQDDSAKAEELARQIGDILASHDTISDQSQRLGATVYGGTCASCHDNGVSRAPAPTVLATLAPEAIMRAMISGPMREQASALSLDEKSAVAEFLSQRRLGSSAAVSAPLMCAADEAWFDYSQPPAYDGWGLNAGNGHAISTADAGLDRGNVGSLRLKWALAFPNALYARSQPAIAAGAIFIGGDDGTVYALDPESGCAHWTFAASGSVRMGAVVESWDAGDVSADPMIFFGDVTGKEYALDAATGELKWQRAMDSHPSVTLTGSPSLYEGTLYVPVSSLEEPAAAAPGYECCTFRGSLVALDARSGDEKWRAYMVDEPRPLGPNADGNERYGPSGVAIWATPLVDPRRRQVYVVTGDNYSEPATAMSDAIAAIDMDTGAIRWSHQATSGDKWNVSCGWVDSGNCDWDAGPDHDFGSGPAMARDAQGRDYLLAGQKSGAVFALDPDNGALRWVKQVGRGGVLGGIHFGIATAGGKVIVPVSDFPDGQQHNLPANPGIHALDLATGDYAWSAKSDNVCGGKRFCEPGYGGAVSVTDELVLAGSTDAHMRIYDAASGAVLWDFDTDRAFETVNGATGHGGSFSGGSAPIAWDGKLIVTSGYGGLGKMPGNVLLVFEAE